MPRCAAFALVLAALAVLAAGSASAQTDPLTVVVLGSSNAEGAGTSHPDSAWAARLERALPSGSRVVNLARGGHTTFHLLPTGTATPSGRPAPDPARNATAAAALAPDAVVVSLTSNDAARNVPVAEQLANYDAILGALGSVPVVVTTPTPRVAAISDEGRAIQAELRRATLATFARPLDLWALVATPDGRPDPAYGAGDGIHYNDAAHARFAEAVRQSLADVVAEPPHAVWDVETDWAAGWVGPADLTPADTQNVWTAYRTRFSLAGAPRQATARIAVDSKYWLWVNGRLVTREGGLKRGPMPGATYADAVDLEPHLRAGENTVAVLVWTWGKPGFSHATTDAPGLLFDLAVDQAPVALDWRARRHPAYGDTGPPRPNYRLPESNVRYDARREVEGWTTRGYHDRLWPAAVPLAPAGGGPWGPLVARPIPHWRDFGLRPYADAPAFPFTTTGDTVVVALPYNAQVTPFFEVDAPAGLVVDVRTDNYRGGGAPNVRAEVVTRAGRQRVEVKGWMNGHDVRYAFPPGVTVYDLRYRETGYDAAFAGAFESSDPALDRLWGKSLRTLYVTMRDTYMDCPDRERAQWWGDVVLEMGEAFYALDRSADALARKGVLELMAWQRPDSTIYSPVPSDPRIWTAELPTQMLASVGHYGVWTYYLHSGDADAVRRVYPAVRDYLAVWAQDGRGLVVPRAGGWTWGDWGDNRDLPLIFNGWYALALRAQVEMARLVGEDADAREAERKLAALVAGFDAAFWTGTAYRSPGHDGATDDRGNALAVLAGLAPEARYDAVHQVLLEERHASPYFEKYVAEALMRMGHVDDALARLKERYAAMIESPLTTLWEGWGIGAEGFGGGTYNHAWSGGPLTLMSQIVAGVEPLTPGYRLFRVAPQLGSLAHVRAVVPSAAGEIVADVRQSAGRYVLDVTVPDGAEAELVVPVAAGRSARVEGADGADVAGELVGGDLLGPGETHAFRVGAGRWRVVAE